MESSFFDILRKKRFTQKELEELQAEADKAKEKREKEAKAEKGSILQEQN